MSLISNWTKSTAALSLTSSAFTFCVGGNNYILTTGSLGDSPYYSTNGGSTWTAATVNDAEWSANTTACLAAISDDGYLYLVNKAISKLYVSTDNGVTYNIASSGTSYTCLACVGSTLFANFSTGTTLYKSTDHGASFTTLTTPDTTASAISISSNGTCLFLCGTHVVSQMPNFNVYRSTDLGLTWIQVLTNYTIAFVGATFHTASSTYLGIYDGTSYALLLMKSDNNFDTSTAIATMPTLQAPTTFGGADSSNDIYFASQFIPGVLCTSPDNGTTLTNETPDTVSPPISLAVGTSSIVAVTSSSSGTSLYSGMLPGGKVLPSTPVISPASTSVLTSPITVTLTTATSDATIYYTLDGSNPTASSTQYTAPFTLSFALPTTCVVKAVAIAGSDSSTIATRTYRIGNQVSAPTITSTAKDYAYITIAIADTTDGAVIYYTTDGTTPTIASTQYTGPFIGLEAANIIKAVAVKANYFDSDVTTTTINTSLDQSDYPTLGPYLNGYMCNPQATSTRKFTTGTTVHVEMISTTNSAYDHAPIYYTLDGTTPTLASTKYTTPLDITESCVITAVAIKGTVAPVVGKVATITYTFSTGVLAKPTAYTLHNEYVNLATGVVSTVVASWHWAGDVSLASTFIPDYNNGVGALAISLYSIGNETPGYIYLCDPITCEPFKRVAAVTPSVSGGSYAITYSPDTGLIYAAADNLHLYSIDIGTGTVVELNALLSSAIHCYLVYNVADRCLYGYCNGGTSNDLVKYNTVTNVFSTLLTNTPYVVDFCDVDTGTLYGHSNSSAGLVTIDRDTGVATPVSITTTNIYLRLIQDTASKEIYGIVYPEWKTLNVYKIDIANSTETLKFSSATTYVSTDAVIASTATTPAPLFSVAAGTYATTQSVSITCVRSNAQIYYTLDGTTPSASSARYATAISISNSCTLKAVAILDGISSSITTASYSISTAVPNPRIIPGTGTFIDSVSVQITCTRIDAQIHYTVDGSAPTAASPLFTSAFTITASTTVKAIAVASGSSDSGITSEQFTIKTSAPAFSLPAGKYAPNIQVKLTCSTANAVMRYTTDGSVPTETSPVYSDHITIHATTTVKVIAYASGKVASDVMSTLYTIAHDMLFCAAWSGSHISNNMQFWGGKPGYIYSVDTSTGTVTQLPMSTARYWRDMTCSVKNKVLYACTSAQSDLGDSGLIYRIDSATGAETPITTTPHYWRGIVYDDVTDTLYGCDIVDTNLGTGGVYRINVTTGEEVLISGSTTALWSCITIDSDTGMLYIGIDMTSWWGGTNTKWGTTLIGVYSLKISTGVMTCIDEANRGYKHITFNKNNGLLYLTNGGSLMSMSINGGYNLISSSMDPTIGYSSITGMLISADMRVVDSTFYNVITYIDTYAYQLAEVVVAPASSGEYFQACVSISLVEAPKPDIPPGVYAESKQIHLTSETEGATIHYTLDGSEPTVNSPVYVAPIAIN